MLLSALAAASVTAAAEKTIVGTSRADVLHGTRGPDKIEGKGGNDKLYGGRGNDKLFGGAGNDLLVGGAGADRISCGAGVDRVLADHKDAIARDCEKVVYTDAVPPVFRDGHYHGTSSQGEVLDFDVSDGGTRIIHVNFIADLVCSPGGSVVTTFTFDGPYVLAPDGSFGFDWSGNFVNSGDTGSASFHGRLDTAGGGSGTAHGAASLPGFDCASDTFGWTARLTER
jgi:Ca2+-binding RTX toxin-like protein